MIYTLLIVMTLLIIAYVVAWIFVPSLREYLEAPNQSLLDNNQKFQQAKPIRGSYE